MIMEYFELNDGNKLPAIGFGTFQIPADITAHAVKTAIDIGYRHIDGAAIYRNEPEVGIGLKRSGINRDSVFVTSKLWNSHRGFKQAIEACDKTLLDLGLEYLDLYLIHWPANSNQFPQWEELNYDSWRALESLQHAGKVKSIGVSNFLHHHLESLLKNASIIPSVNQIEIHPGHQQLELRRWCQANNILIEAWSPLAQGRILQIDTITQISEKYQKTPAQICLRWSIQHGLLPLVKTISENRMSDNIHIWDFTIDLEDMERLDMITPQGYSGYHPDTVQF